MLGKVPVAKSTSRSWTGFTRLYPPPFCGILHLLQNVSRPLKFPTKLEDRLHRLQAWLWQYSACAGVLLCEGCSANCGLHQSLAHFSCTGRNSGRCGYRARVVQSIHVAFTGKKIHGMPRPAFGALQVGIQHSLRVAARGRRQHWHGGTAACIARRSVPNSSASSTPGWHQAWRRRCRPVQ